MKAEHMMVKLSPVCVSDWLSTLQRSAAFATFQREMTKNDLSLEFELHILIELTDAIVHTSSQLPKLALVA